MQELHGNDYAKTFSNFVTSKKAVISMIFKTISLLLLLYFIGTFSLAFLFGAVALAFSGESFGIVELIFSVFFICIIINSAAVILEIAGILTVFFQAKKGTSSTAGLTLLRAASIIYALVAADYIFMAVYMLGTVLSLFDIFVIIILLLLIAAGAAYKAQRIKCLKACIKNNEICTLSAPDLTAIALSCTAYAAFALWVLLAVISHMSVIWFSAAAITGGVFNFMSVKAHIDKI